MATGAFVEARTRLRGFAMITPFDYQEEGIAFLASRRRALLLDDPGTGKTLQLIRAADKLGVPVMQTVCPANIASQWAHESVRLATVKREARICSYDRARISGLKPGYNVLALDEFHNLKTRTAKRTQALYGARADGFDSPLSFTDYCWAASGSPTPNHAGEFYTTLRSVVPGSLMLQNGNIMDYWQFMRRYVDFQETPFGIKINGSKNTAELRDRIAPYALRRTKAVARKGWLKPLVAPVYVSPGSAVKAIRQAESTEITDEIKKVLTSSKASLEKSGYEYGALRRIYGLALVTPIAQMLAEEAEGGLKKIVIVAYHRDVIDELVVTLNNHKLRAVAIMGGMTEAAKAEKKKEFIDSPECFAFVAQVSMLKEGYDGLQHVTGDMLMVECPLGGEDNRQIISRLDRTGQKNPVLCRMAILEGTMHEKIIENVQRRIADAATLLDGEI